MEAINEVQGAGRRVQGAGCAVWGGTAHTDSTDARESEATSPISSTDATPVTAHPNLVFEK